MTMLQNDGPRFVQSNYWESGMWQAGHLMLALNAGAFRLLLPPTWAARIIAEIVPAEYVIVSRPFDLPSSGRHFGLEMLFEDHSDNPFSILLSAAQVDPFPAKSDDKRRFRLAGYAGPGTTPQQIFEYEGYFRLVPGLPCLKAINPRRFR